MWKLLQTFKASWSEDRDRRVTNDYDDFDISCRQLCFFSFPGKLSQLWSCPGGLPSRSCLGAAVFIKSSICQQEDGWYAKCGAPHTSRLSSSGCLRNEIWAMPAGIQQIRDMSNAQKILPLLTFIIYFLFVPMWVCAKTNVSGEKTLHKESYFSSLPVCFWASTIIRWQSLLHTCAFSI